MDTYTSGAQRRRYKAIGPCDYIRCGETSEKVGCSIGSVWVETGAAFDESVKVKFGVSMGEWIGIRSVLLWGLGYLVMSKKISSRVSSLM